MPDFGNFETILLLSEEQGQVSYLAHRRNETSGKKYVIVVFGVRKATEHFEKEDEGIRALGQDLQLAFISAIKAQKRASDAGSRFVAPIYEVGVNSEGAWYATDHFPRGSLANWIAEFRGMDEPSLRSTIASCIAGLWDLKQQTGRSHGNLKSSNVMVPGNSGELGQTGVQITEPLTGTEMDAEQFERADLRAVGALLYQIVCRKEVQNTEQIKYPVAPTHQWAGLGKEGAYWLALCNKLLADPPQTSLDALAREIPPPKPTPKWMPYASAALLALTILALWLRFFPAWAVPSVSLKHLASSLGNGRAREYLQTRSDYTTAIEEAQDQADVGEFTNARGWLTNALSLQFRNRRATKLLQNIIEREAKFNRYAAIIPQQIALARYTEASQTCAQARQFAPKAPMIDQWQTNAALLAEAAQNFKDGYYALAERKFDEVWKANPQDFVRELRERSSRCVDNWDLFQRTKRPDLLELVLRDNPGDARAQAELKRAHAGDAAYLEVLNKGQGFFEEGDYATAAKEFERAVGLRNEPDSKGRLDQSRLLKQLREKADRLYTEKQWRAAGATFAEMVQRNPKDAYAAARQRDCEHAQTGQ